MSKLCDECETVAHCLKHGCIPKQPAPVQDTEAHYKGVVEGVQKLFSDKRTQLVPEEDLYDLAVKADNWGQP
jgi:hypothetical protein